MWNGLQRAFLHGNIFLHETIHMCHTTYVYISGSQPRPAALWLHPNTPATVGAQHPAAPVRTSWAAQWCPWEAQTCGQHWTAGPSPAWGGPSPPPAHRSRPPPPPRQDQHWSTWWTAPGHSSCTGVWVWGEGQGGRKMGWKMGVSEWAWVNGGVERRGGDRWVWVEGCEWRGGERRKVRDECEWRVGWWVWSCEWGSGRIGGEEKNRDLQA